MAEIIRVCIEKRGYFPQAQEAEVLDLFLKQMEKAYAHPFETYRLIQWYKKKEQDRPLMGVTR